MEEAVPVHKFDNNVKSLHSLTLHIFPCLHCNTSEKILAGAQVCSSDGCSTIYQ